MVSPEGWRLAEAHRQAQARIASAAVTDVKAAWPLLDMNRLDTSFPRYAGAVSALTQARRTAASGLGVMFYRNLRDLEAVSGKFNPLPAGPMELGKLNTSLKVTGPVAVRSALARGASPAEAERIAVASTVGAVQSRIYDGGRGAVLRSMQADKRARGYQRVSDGSPCAFCAMLVSRGAVYKSDSSGGFDAHFKCGCQAVPFFELRPEQSAQAADMRRLWDATYEQGGYNAFRRAYERGPTAMIGPRASRAKKSITKAPAVQDVIAATVVEVVAVEVAAAPVFFDRATLAAFGNTDLEAKMQQAWDSEDWDSADIFEAEVERRSKTMQAWGQTYDDYLPLDTVGDAADDLPDFDDIPQRKMTGREVRAEWEADADVRYWDAEQYGGGIRPDLRSEADAKGITLKALFDGDPRVAYKYANPELLQWWEVNGGRRPLYEALAAHGHLDAAKLAQKRLTEDKARTMAQDALGRNRADYLAERAAEAQARRSRRVLSAGDKLAADQKRYQRAKRAAVSAGV